MRRADRLDRKDVHRKNQGLSEAAENRLSDLSESKWKSFLERTEFKVPSMSYKMYKLLSFESLHNLHLGMISSKLK